MGEVIIEILSRVIKLLLFIIHRKPYWLAFGGGALLLVGQLRQCQIDVVKFAAGVFAEVVDGGNRILAALLECLHTLLEFFNLLDGVIGRSEVLAHGDEGTHDTTVNIDGCFRLQYATQHCDTQFRESKRHILKVMPSSFVQGHKL